MSRPAEFWRRLVRLVRRKEFERELEEEICSHFEMKVQENLDAGLEPDEARFAARRQFGNIILLKEESREMWGFGWLDAIAKDLQYGMRMLRKSPGFAAAAVLSLALGIGANTAIFSVIDAVMLKTLPVKDPKHLVLLKWVSGPNPPIRSLIGRFAREGDKGPTQSSSFSYPIYEQFRDRSRVFSSVFAFAELERLNAGIDGQAELAAGQAVSGNYFSGLGVEPIIGRSISTEDDKPGAAPVAVISYGFWQRRFGCEASAIGKTIYLNGKPFTIIGAAPQEFTGTLDVGTSPDVTVPMAFQGQVMTDGDLLNDGDTWWVQIMGRLNPGLSDQQARADLDVVLQQNLNGGNAANEKSDPIRTAILAGNQGLPDVRKDYSEPLFIMLCVVGLVLIIACTNTATLLLARAEARQKEIGIRLSLGASRKRLIRQLLTESVMLSAIGGAFGFALAIWGKDLLISLLPSGKEPPVLNISIDSRILAFTLAVSALTGIIFGLAPAFRATRIDLTSTLKVNAKGGGGIGYRFSLSKILVIAQVAMSLLMLIGAGLFVRTLQNLEKIDAGFNPENVLLFRIDPSLNGYEGERLANLYKEISSRIEAIPGVRAATMSRNTLISGSSWISNLSVQGFDQKISEKTWIYFNCVGSNFFSAMQIPLLMGREIQSRDNENSQKTAVINESLARIFFPNDNPIGKRFRIGDSKEGSEIEIVGLAKDAKYTSLKREAPPTVYIPYLQVLKMAKAMSFEVRISGDPAEIMSAVRREVQATDKNLPLFQVKTQIDQIKDSISQERQFARLSSFFSLLALALACIGLYGIMSYSVARRTNEIGIRMALGAQQREVIWMVMRETLLLISIGATIGLVASSAATRIVSDMLFGIKPTDPITLLAATSILVAFAALSGFIPARRASKVDPMVALRYE